MAKSAVFKTGILKLIYQNIALANIGNGAGLQPSGAAGSFYIALYEDDPTESDSGTESTYTSYARIAVARSAGGWTVTANVLTNAALITFPTSTGGTSTVTHVGIHTDVAAGDLVDYGALSVSVLIEEDDIPKFAIGNLSVTRNS